MQTWMLWATAALLLLAGLVPIGRWLLRRRAPGRRCPHCQYDMGATPGLQCPECGRTAASESILWRRWTRGLFPRWALLSVVLAVLIGTHAFVRRLPGGYWRLAPTSVLLAVLEEEPREAVRTAIWARLVDPDHAPASMAAASRPQWRRLAGACEAMVTAPDTPRDAWAWATVTLAAVIPDRSIVDPIIESGLRSPDCGVRDRFSAILYSYYLTHGELSPVWADDALALACDDGCAGRRGLTVALLARVEPLRRDDVLAIARAFCKADAGASEWQTLCRSIAVARTPEEAAARRRLLHELDRLAEHNGGLAIAAALAELDQYWPEQEGGDGAEVSPP